MVEAIFFGILQGLTEFIPISSTAHIRIFAEFFGMAEDPGAMFTAIMQIGTELAVLIYFRKDIARIITAWVRKAILRRDLHIEEAADARMGWLIIVGSLPIVVLGYLGQDAITTNFLSILYYNSKIYTNLHIHYAFVGCFAKTQVLLVLFVFQHWTEYIPLEEKTCLGWNIIPH